MPTYATQTGTLGLGSRMAWPNNLAHFIYHIIIYYKISELGDPKSQTGLGIPSKDFCCFDPRRHLHVQIHQSFSGMQSKASADESGLRSGPQALQTANLPPPEALSVKPRVLEIRVRGIASSTAPLQTHTPCPTRFEPRATPKKKLQRGVGRLDPHLLLLLLQTCPGAAIWVALYIRVPFKVPNIVRHPYFQGR